MNQQTPEYLLRAFVRGVVESKHRTRKSLRLWDRRPAYLTDDPTFKEKSIYVPDDAKKEIVSWLRSMGLS